MSLPALLNAGTEAAAVTLGTGLWFAAVLSIASGARRSAAVARRRR